MANGDIVSVPDGKHRVEGCSRSIGIHDPCLHLDVEGRRGLTPLRHTEHLSEGSVVTVEDNEVVDVEPSDE